MARVGGWLLVLLFIAACRSPATPPTEGSPGVDCASLTRTHCMQSPDCTLERVAKAQGGTGKLYRCRPAAGPCETGIRQADFHGRGTDGMRRAEEAQLACAARPGCDYDEGGCYCDCRDYGRTAVPDGPEAEDCMCECAGGPPPSCVAGAN